jgi:membrane-bound lytic murein transglycosylase A
MTRRYALLISFLILVIALLLSAVWVLWQGRQPTVDVPAPRFPADIPPDEPPEPPPPELVLRPAELGDLPGWSEDDVAEALPALLATCRVFDARSADTEIGPDGLAGTAADWRAPCAEAARLRGAGSDAVRSFFERHFRPWAATDNGDAEGLFTGYYEPSLRGSRRRHGDYRTPLLASPNDLVQIDLGEFRDDLSGRRIAGRLEGSRLRPYWDREAIDAGRLAGRGLEIVWVDDPVDAFFLEIQGSGRVTLEDGSVLRLGYAGQNGHPYTAIGKTLVDQGELPLEGISMQSIREWLETNPEKAVEVMQSNASYVFFRELRGPGPLGSLGVALTPGRSLAVDRSFLPMGAPVWLAAERPDPEALQDGAEGEEGDEVPAVPFERLMVAQDTGGAIRGPVRGDVFWGPGDLAAEIAGLMKHPGRLWLLLPKDVDPTPAPAE